VLVVLADKDPYDLAALRSGIDAPDREIVEVSDGPNVVTLAHARGPDVVVVAASIGQMGGFAVSRELKTLADEGRIPDPKVIVLLERAADAWIAGWSRCDAWRVKPVDPAEIDEIISDLVGAPSA
jgi:DNA-binding NarL/FixJ family response regulator